MDFKTFLENFDAIAEAPGGIPKLRSLILDLAVRGKLVAQNPEDEPGDELFKKIQESREVLYSKKKASRKKDFLPFNCDEIPFSIPRTWKWARLHERFTQKSADRKAIFTRGRKH
jgi:type I restriction enzyme S subunit